MTRNDAREPLMAMLTRATQSPAIVLLGILALTVAVHIPGLTVWFQTDDFRYLASVRHTSSFATFARQAFDFRHTDVPVPGFLGHYRPLYLIGWLVRYRLFGLNAYAYQVESLILHLVVVVLTWRIARGISGRVLTAHLAALVMALHPAFTRSVIWVAASTDMEVTIGMLVTLGLFLAYIDGGRRRSALYAASIATYAVALCLHPKAVALVPVLAGLCCLRSERGLRELLRPTTVAIGLPFVLMAGAWAGIQQYVQQSHPDLQVLYGFGWHSPKDFLGYAAMAAVPLWHDVWNPGYVLHIHNQKQVLLLGAIVTVDVAIGLVLLVRARHRDAGVALLATGWFVSMVLPLTTFKFGVVDRDLYVAGPALALLVGVAGSWVADAARSRPAVLRPLAAAVLAIAIVLASGWTIRYERQFPRDERHLEAFTVQLQEAYPTLPPGTHVYIVGAPLDLTLLTSLLPYIITTYYPGVEATYILESEAARRQPTLSPTERIFRFRA
jgi:hypothetical protein